MVAFHDGELHSPPQVLISLAKGFPVHFLLGPLPSPTATPAEATSTSEGKKQVGEWGH